MAKKTQVCILGKVDDFQGLSRWLIGKPVDINHFASEDELLSYLANYDGECFAFITPAFQKNNGKDIIITVSEKLLFRHNYYLSLSHRVSANEKMLLMSLGYGLIAENADSINQIKIENADYSQKKAS